MPSRSKRSKKNDVSDHEEQAEEGGDPNAMDTNDDPAHSAAATHSDGGRGELTGLSNSSMIPLNALAAEEAINKDMDEEQEEEDELKHKSRNEDMDENDSEDDDDAEDMDSKKKGGVWSKCGLIKSMVLNNFMCHTCLQVDFGTNVNFIVGENGSGKSAVLTGLVLGLGGKIGSTGRGTKQSTIIKWNCDDASIRLELYNEGEDAFKPELYGDIIRVEKVFKKNGSTILKIKNGETEKTIDSTSSELHAITDQFNIQVDNPVAVLNQEMSKRFFQATKSNKKYELFLEGMQLDVLESLHAQINENVSIQQAALGGVQHRLDIAKTECATAKQEWDDLKKLKGLDEKKDRYTNELVWSSIGERQDAQAQRQGKLDEIKNQIQNYTDKIEDYKDRLSKIAEKETECLQQLAAVDQQTKQLTANSDEVTKVVRERKKIEAERKQMEKLLNKATNDKAKILNNIDKEKAEANEKQATQKADQGGKVEALEQQLSELQQKHQREESDLDRLAQDLLDFERSLANANHEVGKCKAQHSQYKAELDRANRASRDRFAVFGPEIKKVHDRIAKERWNEKPLGPIAFHVQLNDDSWSKVVNLALKGILQSFLCSDQRDASKLTNIMKQEFKNSRSRAPQVYCSPKESRFSDAGGVDNDMDGDKLETINDVITVDDAQVWNHMVNQGRIHQTIVIADRNRCEKLILPTRGQMRLPSAWNGTVWDGYDGDTFDIRGAGVNRTPKSIPKEFKGRYVPFVQNDMAVEIGRVQRDVHDAAQRVQEISGRLKQEQQREKSTKTQQGKMVSAIKKTKNNIYSIEKELFELRDLGDNDDEIDESQWDYLVDEATQLDTHIVEHTQELDGHKEREMDARRREKPLQEKKKLMEKEIKEVQRQAEEFQMALDQQRQYESKESKKLSKVENMIRQLEEDKRSFQEDLRLDAKEIEQEIEAAAKLNIPQVKVSTSSAQLQNKLAGVEKAIAKEQARRGKSAEEVTRAYNDAKHTLDEAQKNKTQSFAFTQQLSLAKESRMTLVQSFKESIGKRCNRFFKQCLEQKGFAGRMKFNHNDKDLLINVDVSGEDSKKVNSKGLSGGEKSFTTACFIVSLWEAMETPFRCLDEFDVFMDDVNRTLSIQMMIEIAKMQQHRQFVYLSPLGMKVLEKYRTDNSIKVIRMRKLVQGQTTLDASVA